MVSKVISLIQTLVSLGLITCSASVVNLGFGLYYLR